MSVQCRNGWHSQFLEAGLKTALPLNLHFISSNKIIELVQRGDGFADQVGRLMLNRAIEMGRGGVFLNLTPEQYAKLNAKLSVNRHDLDLLAQILFGAFCHAPAVLSKRTTMRMSIELQEATLTRWRSFHPVRYRL